MAYLWVTLLGRPGAGKTTVGDTLAAGGVSVLGEVQYISGSRLLEEYIASERVGWREIKERKDRGSTADPQLTHRLLEEKIGSLDGSGVVLLDGFPKMLQEVDMTMAALGQPIDLAILLACPANECVERINQRLVCDRCGVVAKVGTGGSTSFPCPREGCDGVLDRRPDDDCETRIFEQGHESAVVLPGHFERLGGLVTVDALQSPEELISDVAEAIEKRLPQVSPQSGA